MKVEQAKASSSIEAAACDLILHKALVFRLPIRAKPFCWFGIKQTFRIRHLTLGTIIRICSIISNSKLSEVIISSASIEDLISQHGEDIARCIALACINAKGNEKRVDRLTSVLLEQISAESLLELWEHVYERLRLADFMIITTSLHQKTKEMVGQKKRGS